MEVSGDRGPGDKAASKWRDRVLAVYGREIDGLAPVGKFEDERRSVIVSTSERFLAACSW